MPSVNATTDNTKLTSTIADSKLKVAGDKDTLFTDTLPTSDSDSYQYENERNLRKRRKLSDSTLKDENNTSSSVDSKTDNNLRAKADDLVDNVLEVPTKCAEQVEQFAKYIWHVLDHHNLPQWMRDNEYLLSSHRPPMPSVKQCFKSIFRLHTETVNIWTHLIGTVVFIVLATYYLTVPSVGTKWEEKLIFGAFFTGAIVCLLCSTLFHTFYCYSPNVSKFFSKLDYCGISMLVMGSFVPWLYYAFYCEFGTKVAYLVLIGLLGIGCIVVSMWDKFSQPDYRTYRALMFIGFGLTGFLPTIHYALLFGIKHAFTTGALQWLVLMAILYITGASLYAARIPERLFPGRFDIWFQSHQFFHVFVVAAATVHYYGINILARHRASIGDCRYIDSRADFNIESMIS
ncbi:unnamed protein product [Didymodactylos carnosus]|uniref:Adiponectin receptor n=1 Tax=Didymodactylos carnosus TaxID=1234261 RepID=A0A813TV26_9BILA|nr:unnamed protein product [Didymodactylos carnosus]CAF1041702.1 unnamed protein product [Didymodactylos carnosus]CAF3602862.1 unnamed protein product [Didymodactylos carnosus]CAF3809753.1 unnamed protein product [Didymodactylos carnosus]